MNNKRKTINATIKSIRIIEMIKSANGTRLPDLVQELGYSKSTVHSHLNTLREQGYVTKEGEIYHLSLKFFHLGQYTRDRDERYRLAKQKTEELAEELNQAVDFDVETNGRIITLFHKADESTEIGFTEGDYFYVHTSATGKAILAEFSERRVLEILDQWGMKRKTEHTITDPDELLEDLERTRERGYSIVDQEWLEGLRAVGAVVNLPNGRPLGALSTGAPTYRLTDETIEDEIGPKLVKAANELTEDVSEILQ
ncbi:IclR family transcriptional regulator [Halomarina halobia]|uniref:IclR family transcriptional regulator n=1 Tax=Halomarina halobia TaxID=3033386 RepID=A0ABD6AE54_9EURY|nr:IclR family transcriptional regulator [Halomarina sp. PSR21]